MKTFRKSARRIDGWVWPALLATAIFGVSLIIGCGRGGGDDGDDIEDTIGILTQYAFQLGGSLAGNAGQSYIDIVSGDDINLGTQPSIQGTLTCDPVTQECQLQSVSMGSSVLVEDRTDPEVFTDFEVMVDVEWVFDPAGADTPQTGRVRIDPLAAGQPEIIVEVADCGAGGLGVLVTTNPATGQNCYPWDVFDELLETSEDDVAVLASLGWNAISFTLEQAGYVLDAFELIDVHEEILVTGDPFLQQCDAYAANWPGGPPNPGDFLFRWLDDSGNGEVGPGDSFRQAFESCWFDDVTDDIDDLIDGVIEYISYTEVVNQDLITRIGFEGATPGGLKIGGVAYGDEFGNDPLVLTETIEENGTITTDAPVILTGKYVLVFFEP